MLVDTTEDGAIVLRPAGTYSVEIYSDERLREFLGEDALTTEMREHVSKALTQRGRR